MKMTRSLSFAIGAAAAFFLGACGSAAPETAQNTGVANKNAVSANSPTVSNSGDVTAGPAVTDANSVAGDALMPSNVAEQKQAKIERLQQGNGDPSLGVANAKPLRREAPDNSEYWSTLTDVAVETRAFRDHPEIAKAERISDGKTTTIKVYLRTGKVVQASDDRVRDFPRASVNTFAAIAGVKPVATPTPPPATGPGKEKPITVFPKVQ